VRKKGVEFYMAPLVEKKFFSGILTWCPMNEKQETQYKFLVYFLGFLMFSSGIYVFSLDPGKKIT
jgi:hypothetical protein